MRMLRFTKELLRSTRWYFTPFSSFSALFSCTFSCAQGDKALVSVCTNGNLHVSSPVCMMAMLGGHASGVCIS